MSLRAEQHPCWVAECDHCGEGDNAEYGGSFHHPTEAFARQVLADDDWFVMPNGQCLCLGCFERLRGELPCPHGGRCDGGCGDGCPTPTIRTAAS